MQVSAAHGRGIARSMLSRLCLTLPSSLFQYEGHDPSGVRKVQPADRWSSTKTSMAEGLAVHSDQERATFVASGPEFKTPLP